MKNLKTTLIELPATLNGQLNGIPSKDVYSLVKLPSRAIDLLTAILKEAGSKILFLSIPLWPPWSAFHTC
jgi:hypothetical protein